MATMTSSQIVSGNSLHPKLGLGLEPATGVKRELLSPQNVCTFVMFHFQLATLLFAGIYAIQLLSIYKIAIFCIEYTIKNLINRTYDKYFIFCPFYACAILNGFYFYF